MEKLKILIHRNVGGIGDAMCFTTPLSLFIAKNSNRFDIDIAFPKYTHPVFENLFDAPNVRILDSALVKKSSYANVIEVGNPCPAAQYESARRNKVIYTRIQLFAKGLGLDHTLFKDARPLLVFSEDEGEHIEKLRSMHPGNVVGIALHSSEGYRDYPYMSELIDALTARDDIDEVFLFGTKLPNWYVANKKHFHLINTPLRMAFAAQKLCKVFISVDSLFLHSAAALNKSTILIDGPLASEYRFKPYGVNRLTANIQCVPCWRNGSIPCLFHPDDVEKSYCMGLVSVDKILEAYDNSINKVSTGK